MDAAALAAAERADAARLIGAGETEPRDERAAVDLLRAELDELHAVADRLPDGLLGAERVARLFDEREFHAFADLEGAAVGLLGAGDHAKQRGLARAVRADDADDAAGREGEADVLHQHVFAVRLGD